jgi:hypothetical protein
MAPEFSYEKGGRIWSGFFPHRQDGKDAVSAHQNAAKLAEEQGVTVKEQEVQNFATPGAAPCEGHPHKYGADGKPIVEEKQ